MIISIHLPKTAGTSFAAELESHFGDRLLGDYNDQPFNCSQKARNHLALKASINLVKDDYTGIKCIHGHFLPLKYISLLEKNDTRFVTWMRHPVDRLLSHYLFWKKAYIPESATYLHKKFIEENWSIERFCFCKDFKNLYEQYFWGFPICNFDFIGVFEFYEEDRMYFSKRYKIPMPMESLHLRRSEKLHNNIIDDSLRKEIEAFHEKDMKLYNEALKYRLSRENL